MVWSILRLPILLGNIHYMKHVWGPESGHNSEGVTCRMLHLSCIQDTHTTTATARQLKARLLFAPAQSPASLCNEDLRLSSQSQEIFTGDPTIFTRSEGSKWLTIVAILLSLTPSFSILNLPCRIPGANT